MKRMSIPAHGERSKSNVVSVLVVCCATTIGKLHDDLVRVSGHHGDNFVSLEQFDGSEVDLLISTTIGEKYSEAKLVTVLNAGAFR